ncbi:hypothetical protein MPRF_41710 [Mycolicibacterium parafortuitum]|uniref:Uncharacterized protein n=1 Tax=Mycolicibacterium parafortuitum TaxID=39692 RepID=A0A7I7U7B7_MYCPF|nr:hypothetical protein [Mycolicibacterium parafortuitum]BBY77272.1 hypothetical protein MPRF_41710 [Mycolicibacterium parafortuitum]
MVRAGVAPVIGAAAFAALIAAAPSALADPAVPPAPQPVPGPSVAPAPAAPAAGIDLAAPAAEGVPHLASPDNLPPGTTGAPAATPGKLGYLRELWHAMRTQEVSGGDALLLFTQRPLSSGPQQLRTPVPAAEAATVPAPVPATAP